MKKVTGIAVLLLIATFVSYRFFLIYNPDTAYEWITNNKLPEDVQVVSYSTVLTDNLLHFSHIWEFTHNKEGMSKLLKQIGAGNVFENYANVKNYSEFDAIWVLPSIEKALNKKIPRGSIGKGYEISSGNNRDNWLLVDKKGNRSYYEFN